MRSQSTVLVLVLGLAASLAVVAQTGGSLRWPSGAAGLGLQPSAGTPLAQCGPFSLACDASTVLPLYASRVAPRSLSMQVGAVEGAPVLKAARPQGLSLALVGKASLLPEVGVYGRVGAVMGRGSGFAAMPGSDTGMTYGVGLSWDFSRRASAVLGFDSYDVRGVGDVRATSVGLQWRY